MLEIDPGLSIEQLTQGSYLWVDPRLTSEVFLPFHPDCRKIRYTLDLPTTHLDRDEYVRMLRQRGLRPWMAWDLALYGKLYPKASEDFPIVALGDFHREADGRRLVAVHYTTYGGSRGVCLGLTHWSRQQFPRCRVGAYYLADITR